MSRVINTDSTGKHRAQHMRLAAEILRRLSQKPEIDAEAKDMVARLVYAFRDVDDGIEQSAGVWDNRDYYMKAEELRRRWHWAKQMAVDLQSLVYREAWSELPTVLVKLLPHVSDITVTKFTRKESEWDGAYMRLMGERSPMG